MQICRGTPPDLGKLKEVLEGTTLTAGQKEAVIETTIRYNHALEVLGR
jgi:hypothetical protein